MFYSLLISAICCGIWAVWIIITYLKRNKVFREGIRVQGTIIAEHEDDSGEATTYHPVIRFRTHDGQEVIATAEEGSGYRVHLGEEVSVCYMPDQPSKIFVVGSSPIGYWLGILMLLTVMGVFLYQLIINYW